MAYRVVEKIINITGSTFNSWEEFEVLHHTNKSIEELANMFLEVGNNLQYPSEKVLELSNFLSTVNYTVSWDNETQTAIRTIDWPDEQAWNLYLNLKPIVFIDYWENICARVEIQSQSII